MNFINHSKRVWSCNGETNQQWELRDGRLRSAEGLILNAWVHGVYWFEFRECTGPAVLCWD